MHSDETADRDIRQRDLVPPVRLAAVHAVVVRLGAGGAQAALQLAALGAPKLTLVDFDTVEPANLAPQGFRPSDLGRSKVEAVGEVCHDVNPMLDLETVAERFRRPMVRTWTGGGSLAVFCCVDSIGVRRVIWESVRDHAGFFADAVRRVG